MDCYRQIFKEGGLPAFWTGWGPNVIRNSIINAAELSTYDQTKETLLRMGYQECIPLHIVCGMNAGFVACCVGSPADVLGTRIMNASKGKYKGPVDCFIKMMKTEGPASFYKGFLPNLFRMAGYNTVLFLTYEQVKRQFE